MGKEKSLRNLNIGNFICTVRIVDSKRAAVLVIYWQRSNTLRIPVSL